MGIIEKLSGKKLLLWGYGREGKSTEQFLSRHCKQYSLTIFEGKTLEECENEQEYDYILKSPGIPYFTEDTRVISQTSLFLEEFSGNTIGITGTKGKSTTTSLLFTVLNQLGKDVLLVGNIGLPCLDYYDSIKEDTIVVFEMSCHQLALLKQSPHISVLLNLYEDHLDYYHTVERYANAKFNILRHQKEGDICLVNEEITLPFDVKSHKIELESIVKLEQDWKDASLLAGQTENGGKPLYELSIVGHCHQYNAKVVDEICTNILGLEHDQVLAAMKEFHGLAHRLEYVGEKDGITYYDDSISTICESAIQAIESTPKIDTILIGGLDRGIDYTILADYLMKHQEVKVICMYESGKKIHEMLTGRQRLYLTEDLAEAVSCAKEITQKEHACVLSPAAASYGYFKNFEERGDRFKELVMS